MRVITDICSSLTKLIRYDTFPTVYDANAKLPSGLLNGNINQLGDFDQCLRVRGPTDGLVGKYCLAYIQINIAKEWTRLNRIRKYIQSHDAFVSEFNDVSMIAFIFIFRACGAVSFWGMFAVLLLIFYVYMFNVNIKNQWMTPSQTTRDDAITYITWIPWRLCCFYLQPGHRVPRFSLINWAVCVPSGCSHTDVEHSMNAFLLNATADTGIEYQLRVEKNMCQIKEPMQIKDPNTLLALYGHTFLYKILIKTNRIVQISRYFFIGILAIALISTAIELFTDKPCKIYFYISRIGEKMLKGIRSCVMWPLNFYSPWREATYPRTDSLIIIFFSVASRLFNGIFIVEKHKIVNKRAKRA